MLLLTYGLYTVTEYQRFLLLNVLRCRDCECHGLKKKQGKKGEPRSVRFCTSTSSPGPHALFSPKWIPARKRRLYESQLRSLCVKSTTSKKLPFRIPLSTFQTPKWPENLAITRLVSARTRPTRTIRCIFFCNLVNSCAYVSSSQGQQTNDMGCSVFSFGARKFGLCFSS